MTVHQIRPEMTADYLRSVFIYDENTGVFTWRRTVASRAKAGTVAGYVTEAGYIRIEHQGKAYMAHVLAWLYVYGVWPDKLLDHKDEDKANNRIGNLRLATSSENQQNITKPQRNNKSGVTGVCWHKQHERWYARICINGKTKVLGLFDDLEDAKIAYERAQQELHTFLIKKEAA